MPVSAAKVKDENEDSRTTIETQQEEVGKQPQPSK